MENQALWELQKQINDNTNDQFIMFIQQLQFILETLEDHERDMQNMCDEINKLRKQLSEKTGD